MSDDLQLKYSELRYRRLFEAAQDGILILNAESGMIEDVNPYLIKMLGYSREEFVKKKLWEMGAFKDVETSKKAFAVLQDEKYIRYEDLPLRAKNGTLIQVEFVSNVYHAGSEKIIQCNIRDITDRIQAEAAMKMSEAKFRRLFEAAQDGILILDAETGMIEDVNPFLIKMLGYSREEFVRKKLWEVGAFRDVESSKESFEALQANEYIRYEHLPLKAKNGHLIEVEFVSNVYWVGKEKVIQCNIRDITERRKVEEEIREQLEERVQERTVELVYANRVKDEFLANMSHELRTPLNGILGFSEAMFEGVYGPLLERQKPAVQMIQSSGEHLLQLINDILDISKIEAGKFEFQPEEMEVNKLCQSSLAFVKQPANKKSITIEYLSPDTAHTIFVDSRRFKQILINLLSNAVKFTPAKGTVKLEVQPVARENLMRFSVTDTGIGISSEDVRKLFNPFVQLDAGLSRQHAGSGLGLALVKKLVEMHDGHVEVQSTPGYGSSFIVELPWDQKAQDHDLRNLFEVAAEKNNARVGYISIVRGKILFAEDHETNVIATRDYLESRGYQVFVARDGREVLTKAEEIFPDIILMDIQMPHLNGFDAARRLRADPRFATVPIIALTALAMSGDREECLEAGMNEYLSKPVKLKELEQMIERFLNSPADPG